MIKYLEYIFVENYSNIENKEIPFGNEDHHLKIYMIKLIDTIITCFSTRRFLKFVKSDI